MVTTYAESWPHLKREDREWVWRMLAPAGLDPASAYTGAPARSTERAGTPVYDARRGYRVKPALPGEGSDGTKSLAPPPDFRAPLGLGLRAMRAPECDPDYNGRGEYSWELSD